MFFFLVHFFGQIHDFFSGLDPAFLDLAKMLLGSMAWIGGFVVFVRLKEKNRKIRVSVIRLEKNT